jgi:hypothetical protein
MADDAPKTRSELSFIAIGGTSLRPIDAASPDAAIGASDQPAPCRWGELPHRHLVEPTEAGIAALAAGNPP